MKISYVDFINSLSLEEKEEIKESLYLYFFENFEDEGRGLLTALSDQIDSIEQAGLEGESYYPALVKIKVKLNSLIN
tara:strand:- start:1006 stop:1236 length:231 start_codon:yes stop_codon:yes gene_type:complete